MKVKASEFMSRSSAKKTVEVPTIVVSKRSGSAPPSKPGAAKTFYNVDSLDRLVSVFDENERSLRSR